MLESLAEEGRPPWALSKSLLLSCREGKVEHRTSRVPAPPTPAACRKPLPLTCQHTWLPAWLF